MIAARFLEFERKEAMKVQNVMTRPVVAARADTDLAHVARLMWDNDCGSVPVVDAENRVVGMLTDRDLCMASHFSGRSLREQRASGCMAARAVTCLESDSVATVAKLMAWEKVRRVVVTDEGGRLRGLVSVGDLLGAAADAGAAEKKSLQTAVVAALTAICARPAREVSAPPSTDKPATKSPKRPKAARVAKRGGTGKGPKKV